MQIPSMPFKILALAPFRSNNDTAWSEDPIQIDKTNLDQVINELRLSFYVEAVVLCSDSQRPVSGRWPRDQMQKAERLPP